MNATDAITGLIEQLCTVSEKLRGEASACDGETAEILRAAANTAAVQAMRWRMFGEMNLGRRFESPKTLGEDTEGQRVAGAIPAPSNS